MIEIKNVTKRFHSLVALNNISLRVPKGEVLGVLGPNGAGKTTLFKTIAGLLHPDAGQIQPTSASWPAIGYKPERLLFPNHLRVREYLEMVTALCNLNRVDAARAVDESLTRMNLVEAANKRIKDCSKGMRQRLGLAQVTIGDPPLLLLDEPSNGLDPEGQSDICHHIADLHATGKTIVLASHQLQEVTEVCTHLIILNHGNIHYENSVADALSERPHVVIQVDQDTSSIQEIVKNLDHDIEVSEQEVILNNEAIYLRRQVLSILLSLGFDVVRVRQSRVTLAEIYAEAVR